MIDDSKGNFLPAERRQAISAAQHKYSAMTIGELLETQAKKGRMAVVYHDPMTHELIALICVCAVDGRNFGWEEPIEPDRALMTRECAMRLAFARVAARLDDTPGDVATRNPRDVLARI